MSAPPLLPPNNALAGIRALIDNERQLRALVELGLQARLSNLSNTDPARGPVRR